MANVHGCAVVQRETLIVDYLKHFSKSLNKEHIERIAGAPQTHNPLYLRVLLEELRIFGSYDELNNQIEHYLGAKNPIELYEKVLSRLESDYEQERPQLVKEAFSLLWAARRGLTRYELLEILDIPQAIWSPLFLAVQDALVNRGGLLNFFHDYLRQAVARRYLPTVSEQERWHLRLADYFEKQEIGARVADELPWHLDKAGEKGRLRDCISEIPMFLQFGDYNKVYELWGYWLWLGAQETMVSAYEQALAEYEQAQHNENHLAYVLHQLAYFLEKTGYYTAAEPLYYRALTISEKVLGAEHPLTTHYLNDLAALLVYKGDYDGAEPLYRRALAISEKVLGAEHPDTAESLDDFALLHQAPQEFKVLLSRKANLLKTTLAVANTTHRCHCGIMGLE
jgi:tetratricopeptide (TPR) repeat protein